MHEHSLYFYLLLLQTDNLNFSCQMAYCITFFNYNEHKWKLYFCCMLRDYEYNFLIILTLATCWKMSNHYYHRMNFSSIQYKTGIIVMELKCKSLRFLLSICISCLLNSFKSTNFVKWYASVEKITKPTH